MEVPGFLQARVAEIIGIESDRAERERLWATVLRARIFPDGNMWCCLYGENVQEGIAGFGNTPEQAMWEFEKAMSQPLKPEARHDA